MTSVSPTTASDADPSRPASYTSHHVDVDGLRLHYLDYGTHGRRPMLCVHGGAAHAHWFDFVAGGFSDDHHVLSLDQRGHGDSAPAEPPDYSYERYAADIDEVVRKLDLRDFVLVGHSMGGMISLRYQASYPGRARALVVIDSTMVMSEERIASLREVGTRAGASYATQEEFVARYRLRPPGTAAAPEVLRHLALVSARKTAEGRWRHKFDRRIYSHRQSQNGFPLWGRVRIPALLVKGAVSGRITPEIEAQVRVQCPHVEVVEVPNANHHVTLDAPGQFVHRVRPFLARHT